MVSGAIAILKENSGNFLLLNPELEKVICREAYLQESDLIELDGNAIGPCLASQDRTVDPTSQGKLWCTHLREMKAAIAANIPR